MASKKKAAWRGGRPKNGSGPNKSDFIREKLKAGMSAGDIVKAGVASGMKISTSLVHNVKGRMGGTASSVAAPKRAGTSRPKPTNGKMTASDFIRSQPTTMKATEIIAAGKAKGIKVSSSLVYMVRSSERTKGGSSVAKGKPGRKPRGVVGLAAGDISTFKKMALDLGIATARQALDELERGLAALLG